MSYYLEIFIKGYQCPRHPVMATKDTLQLDIRKVCDWVALTCYFTGRDVKRKHCIFEGIQSRPCGGWKLA
jgi:hypothetical protein